ncbi:hypothetical protein SAMN04488587_1071 [Methanococcoides vulcani]|uniref:Uncharacterized protein n=1 Tax=Methanococcoides vulcani TaxID=1353158 RepID=A0A1H9ZH09_9EURY|nr:hypothetical protein SAMN04488587_1071 [Methanococcoides vulcani]
MLGWENEMLGAKVSKMETLIGDVIARVVEDALADKMKKSEFL